MLEPGRQYASNYTHAGLGIAVGTNGITVFEHTDGTGNFRAVISWPGSITAWTHIAVVYNNMVPSLYVDGQLVATGAASTMASVSPTDMIFGGYYTNMQGMVDEIRVWNYARSQQQLQAYMDQYVDPASSGLARYWQINATDGSTVKDLTSNADNKTLPGGYGTSAAGASYTSNTPPVSATGAAAGDPYRYGFNGKEQDGDIDGTGVDYDYGMRIYDARIGKFLSVDPLQTKFPFYTPYQFAGNTPVQAVDLDGREEYHYTMTMDNQGRAVLHPVGKPQYANHHSLFFGLWQFDTKIDVKRYIVDYNGATYHIGFAAVGTGYGNAWKAQDFENNYIKKPGDAIAFEYNYVDDLHSQAGSDANTVVNAQNKAIDVAIPMEGAESGEGPSQTPNKAAAEVHNGLPAPSETNAGEADGASGRNAPGTATGSGKNITGIWLRGSSGNAGFVPESVANQLGGKEFNSFDDFRTAFWKAVATDENLANQFSKGNVARMQKGYAPIAPQSQWLGEAKSYVLHHQTPIQHGGEVYGIDNLMVTTPRYHKEVLSPSYHY